MFNHHISGFSYLLGSIGIPFFSLGQRRQTFHSNIESILQRPILLSTSDLIHILLFLGNGMIDLHLHSDVLDLRNAIIKDRQSEFLIYFLEKKKRNIQFNAYRLLPSQMFSVSSCRHGMSRNVSCCVHLSVLPSWQLLTWSCSAAHILPSPKSWHAPSFIQFPNILSVFSKIIDLVHISYNFL